MKLYKYVSERTIRLILETYSIRFTQPSELNDPFEMKPVCKETIHELDPMNILSKSDMTEYFRMLFDINYLSLCMSKCKDSILMWTHYAENHTGVMIEFNMNSEFFNTKQKTGIIFNVPYASKRPVMISNDIIKKMCKMTCTSSDVSNYLNCIFTKSLCWKYEKEVRFIKPVSSLVRNDGKIVNYDNDSTFLGLLKIVEAGIEKLDFKDIFLYKLSDDTIKSIYFGLKTSDSLKKEIIKNFKNRKFKVDFYQAYESEEKFKILYKKL